MHSELWEWERDTLFVEGSIYVLVHVEVYTPIVGSIHPYTDGDVHATIGQCTELNERCRVLQDAAVLVDDVQECRLGQFKICAIFYTIDELKTAGLLAIIICYHGTAHGSVRGKDDLIVRCGQYGVEDLNVGNGTRCTG